MAKIEGDTPVDRAVSKVYEAQLRPFSAAREEARILFEAFQQGKTQITMVELASRLAQIAVTAGDERKHGELVRLRDDSIGAIRALNHGINRLAKNLIEATPEQRAMVCTAIIEATRQAFGVVEQPIESIPPTKRLETSQAVTVKEPEIEGELLAKLKDSRLGLMQVGDVVRGGRDNHWKLNEWAVLVYEMAVQVRERMKEVNRSDDVGLVEIVRELKKSLPNRENAELYRVFGDPFAEAVLITVIREKWNGSNDRRLNRRMEHLDAQIQPCKDQEARLIRVRRDIARLGRVIANNDREGWGDLFQRRAFGIFASKIENMKHDSGVPKVAEFLDSLGGNGGCSEYVIEGGRVVEFIVK